VEEGVAVQADVHEGRLHPRQDVDDLPLVDVAGERLAPFYKDVDQGAVFDDGDAGLVRFHAGNDLACHVHSR